MPTIEKSVQELMNEAFYLACDLTFGTLCPLGDYFNTRNNLDQLLDKEREDRIIAWSDGLMEKYYFNQITGRCSLQAMIDFDLEKWENDVKNDIEMMKAALKIVGKPVKLTFAEMQKRGYRGTWAGYTEREDAEYYLQRAKGLLVEAEIKYNNIIKTNGSYDESYRLGEEIRYYKNDIQKYTEKLLTVS